MATTAAQDAAFFNTTINNFGAKAASSVRGGVTFAGNYWPPRDRNTLKYMDAEAAINNAREILLKGYVTVSAGCRNDPEAAVFMDRWFGIRNTGTGANDRDWWLGAKAIIGALESFILKAIHLYYRGDASVIGQPTDYPGRVGNLVQRDIDGYAESHAGHQNNIVGLCSDFFRKVNGRGSTMNLHGQDSVGGTIIHELSHNICSTQDHANWDDTGTCYGTDGCWMLAAHKPSRAWYNADNIEYFCEDVYYGFYRVPTAPAIGGAAPAVAGPAVSRVGMLKQRFGG